MNCIFIVLHQAFCEYALHTFCPKLCIHRPRIVLLWCSTIYCRLKFIGLFYVLPSAFMLQLILFVSILLLLFIFA